MSFYAEMVYPALVSRLGNPKPIQALREQIVPLARGVVLEIGVGSGANFPYYDQANVERLYALEPNLGMLRLAEAQRRRTLVAEFKVKVHALKAATKFAHTLRNEYIAHRNREVALQVRPIPASSLQQVQTAIAAIDDALHVVDKYFTKRLPTMYDHLDIRGGSESLLWIVRRGLVAQDDDISHHRPMMHFAE